MTNNIFNFKDEDAMGTVLSVDTTSVIVQVGNIEQLRKLQVNRLVALHCSRPGQFLIGSVQKITRTHEDNITEEINDEDISYNEKNLVKVLLVGTLIDKIGEKINIFRRTLEVVPEIDANCFSIEKDALTNFMRIISDVDNKKNLSLGAYTLDENAKAYLNGNKFFQRHAIIVGSTGSGKSWTTATILEQTAELDNAIVFDIHGEYKTLKNNEFQHLKIAGPNDNSNENILYTPYWLLTYDALISLFVDRSDNNAPNQAMVIHKTIIEEKMKFLQDNNLIDTITNFTIDSPIPFNINSVIKRLNELNREMVKGSNNREKQGDFNGKLSRLIARLENKISDKRLSFMFGMEVENVETYKWLEDTAKILIGPKSCQENSMGGVKIIDFSEVPSDILPLIVSLIARIIFSIQQWTDKQERHPIAIFCDEAHLYIPEYLKNDPSQQIATNIFERIAKEGRKYGLGLVVISQRPSEVNRTVLSQCNNLVAMRLTNMEDQNVVRRLLPDSLGGFSNILPILDTGEALVVGDASLLPSRIRISEPNNKPDSGTIPFWDEWKNKDDSQTSLDSIHNSVNNWRKQSIN